MLSTGAKLVDAPGTALVCRLTLDGLATPSVGELTWVRTIPAASDWLYDQLPDVPGRMVVCGDDGLAHRLAAELRDVYRERVTLVVPGARDSQPTASRRGGRGLGLFGRLPAAR
ncbi:hypothetical protein ACFWUZ_17685 [Streptomyces sp. NPDC058646]|uniref:hypothetical protein n=1 Tax=Streptomyces sp. NPDC058646 TaxID=3346574 RepID=UPI0036516051